MDLDLLPPLEADTIDADPRVKLPGLVVDVPKPVAKVHTEVRRLTVAEVGELVEPQFTSRGNAMPDPATSVFFGVVRDGRPTGSFITLQLRLHADPMLLVGGDQAMVGSLVAAVREHILQTVGVADVYVFTPPGNNTAELAALFGMQAEPWTVFSKRVGEDEKEEVTQ